MKDLISRPNPKHTEVMEPAFAMVHHVSSLFQSAVYHKKFFLSAVLAAFIFRNRFCSLCGNRTDSTGRGYRFKELEL